MFDGPASNHNFGGTYISNVNGVFTYKFIVVF